MRWLLIFVSVLFVAEIEAAPRQKKQRLIIGKDIYLFHRDAAELHGGSIAVDPIGDDDGEHDGNFVTALTPDRIEPFVVRRSQGLRNGYAGIGIRDRLRYIIYDPAWYNYADDRGSRTLVFAHEIGHHYCGHTDGRSSGTNTWGRELEADRYAGWALEQANADIHEALAAARRTYSPFASASHPPLEMRLAAIWDGYKNGSPCSTNIIWSNVDTKHATSYWMQDGSVLLLAEYNGALRFYYDNPRAELNWLKGKPFFLGKIVNGKVEGTLYRFKEGCRGPNPSYAQGSMSSNGKQIFLSGTEPPIAANCRSEDLPFKDWKPIDITINLFR